MKMTAASMFSGIGGAELALPEADWLFCAEIEPFPSAVLATRFGYVNLGDITAQDFIARAQALIKASDAGRLDLLCGGPPCQAFSVAGLRKGMEDPRGQLSIRFLDIAHAIRPRNLLVENVPGWLSHPDNAFGCFLGGLVGAGDALPNPLGGSWPRAGMVAGPRARAAWRVLDAQYAGLAQRRERVFLVADLGDGADPAAILFERKSLRGNHPPRRDAGEGIAGTLSARAEGGGGLGTDFDLAGGSQPVGCAEIAPTLNAHFGDKLGLENQHIDGGAGLFVAEVETFLAEPAHTLRAEGFDASEDGTGRGTPLVPIAFSSKDFDADATDDLSPTLRAGGHNESHPNGGVPVAVAFDTTQITSAANYSNPKPGDPCHPLAAGAHPPAMAEGDGTSWAVRRLTPTECERLQGYPDGHTLIETGTWRTVDADEAAYLAGQGANVVLDNQGRRRTNAAADGPRYKGLGNAWAVACVRPIAQALRRELTA